MTVSRLCLRAAACLVLASMCSVRAFASFAATLPDPSTLSLENPNNTVVGWEFSPSTDIDVTALGIFDLDGDGLTDVHTLAIWTSAGDLLTQQLMAPGSGATLIDQFRYIDIAPVRLLGDEKYIIGAFFPGTAGDAVAVASFASEFETNPVITALGGRSATGSGFSFPDVETADYRFGPNFRFSVVPLPAAFYLLLAGLGTLLGVRSRGRL